MSASKRRRLTTNQLLTLIHFAYSGMRITDPGSAHPSLRRLIKRGLIEKSRILHGAWVYRISDLGRSELEKIQ